MKLQPTIKFTAKDARVNIVIPSDLDHKYSRGVLGVIAGSAQYPGAAVLVCSAAMNTGVGMVRFNSSSGLSHMVLHKSPEVVVQPGKVSAWLLGPGIQSQKYSHFSTWLRHRWFKLARLQSVPTVLDAGALYLAGQLPQPTLITPHAGELAVLLKDRGVTTSAEAIEGDPKKRIRFAADSLNVVVLLKGSTTYVADSKRILELPKATPWLATAGTGDVLAGIIGSLVATHEVEILNDSSYLADLAATGAFIHNRAAELASGGGPLSASSLLEKIPTAITNILKR